MHIIALRAVTSSRKQTHAFVYIYTSMYVSNDFRGDGNRCNNAAGHVAR